jgi:hypothetical protein
VRRALDEGAHECEIDRIGQLGDSRRERFVAPLGKAPRNADEYETQRALRAVDRKALAVNVTLDDATSTACAK